MIKTRTHVFADYFLGAAYIFAPYLLGFSGVNFARDVFTVIGFVILGYSLLTGYRHSLIKAVPLTMHLTFDVVTGAFVILAPWIYGYRDELTPTQLSAHWALGMGTITLAAFSVIGRRAPRRILIPEVSLAKARDHRPRRVA